MDNETRNDSHLRLITGGAGMIEPSTRINLKDRMLPIPKWQIAFAIAAKLLLLGSVYFLIKG